MHDIHWEKRFREVHDHGVAAWTSGRRSPRSMFGPDEAAFLSTIGCSAQELFDFVDDALQYGEPDYPTILRCTAIRRAYFLDVEHGKHAGKTASMSDLPAKSAQVDGIAWLPRMIEKARLKLRGEMPADLMYGCGGDRQFLRGRRIDLPGFLELVRDSGDDDRRIIDTYKSKS